MVSDAPHADEIVDAEIVGAQILDPKIVDGKIIDGRIVGGRVVMRRKHPTMKSLRAFHRDHRHTEAIAIAGLGMAFLLMYIL